MSNHLSPLSIEDVRYLKAYIRRQLHPERYSTKLPDLVSKNGSLSDREHGGKVERMAYLRLLGDSMIDPDLEPFKGPDRSQDYRDDEVAAA